MKKNIGLIMICFVIGFLLFFGFMQTKRTTYEFSPKASLAFFGKEPKAFFDTYYEYYNTCEDFRNYAEISEEGNLILRLSHKQETALLQAFNSGLEELKKIPGIEIDDDYTRITITGNKEEVEEIIWNEMSVLTVLDMSKRQLIINKIKPEKITVTVIIVDENTGETVYTATWPQEEVRLSTGDWQFNE